MYTNTSSQHFEKKIVKSFAYKTVHVWDTASPCAKWMQNLMNC